MLICLFHVLCTVHIILKVYCTYSHISALLSVGEIMHIQSKRAIELLLLSRDTTHQPQGARIDAWERSNSVEGRVLNPLSYLENGIYLAGRESRSSAILPRSSIGESVSTKHLIRRVEYKYIRPWRKTCIFWSTLIGPTIIFCIVIM